MQRTYLYGRGRIPQQSSTEIEYSLGDALASVRQLVDVNGEVTLARDYQPYGETLSSSGAGTSVYGFTGEAADPSGLVYLRARYYSPAIGRFTTKDSWQGDYNRPVTLNGWTYAYSNPIRFADSTGHDPIGNCIALLAALAVADGPLPVGETAGAIACAILLGGATYTAVTAAQHAPDLVEGVETTCNWIEWLYNRPTSPNPYQQPDPEQKPAPQPLPIPSPSPYKPEVTDTPEPEFVLYHYTKAENIPSIIATGLKPSIRLTGDPKSDAQWGDGQYLTDLTPSEASSTTRYKVSYALFMHPYKLGAAPNNLMQVGWLAIDVTDFPVTHVAPLFGDNFRHRSIFLNPSTNSLPVADRVRGTGTLEFQPSPSGYR